jgi:hypothetical protein
MAGDKSNISYYHFLRNQKKVHKQRLGFMAPILGLLLILGFAVFLFPLFLYMLLFNRLYFWVRNQNPIDRRPYYKYDRHRVPHLGWMDKVWCEYCEWANGSLQWIGDVVKEIERRYCPIQNQCDPHCSKVKEWRSAFLPHDHSLADLEKYMHEGGYEAISVVEKKEP